MSYYKLLNDYFQNFHGQILGENFIDFMNKWTQLGCVGTEDWQFEPFLFSKVPFLFNMDEYESIWMIPITEPRRMEYEIAESKEE